MIYYNMKILNTAYAYEKKSQPQPTNELKIIIVKNVNKFKSIH